MLVGPDENKEKDKTSKDLCNKVCQLGEKVKELEKEPKQLISIIDTYREDHSTCVLLSTVNIFQMAICWHNWMTGDWKGIKELFLHKS